MTLLFEPLADHEGQLEGAVRAVALSFGQGVDGTRAWLRNEAGLENLRVAGRVGGPSIRPTAPHAAPRACSFVCRWANGSAAAS